MPLNSKTIFFISLWMILKSQETLCDDTWNPVTVARVLLGNKTLTTAELSASSDMVCAMTASRLHWPNLFCFSAGVCLFSSFMAVPKRNQASISDPEECMTKLKGCIYNDKLYHNGVAVPQPPPICSKFFCQDGNLVKYPPVLATGSCVPPFQVFGSECLFVRNSPEVDYCAASDFCDGLGAVIWTFSGMTNYTSYFTSVTKALDINSLGDFYLGLHGNGSNFQWWDGTLFQAPSSSSLWYFEPNGILDGICVRTAVGSKLYFQPCTSMVPRTLCQNAI